MKTTAYVIAAACLTVGIIRAIQLGDLYVISVTAILSVMFVGLMIHEFHLESLIGWEDEQ